MNHEIIAGAGPLSSILGPADRTHGIGRPVQNVVPDSNPNLTVQLLRQPRGPWLGVRAEARWKPQTGLGVGSGTLLDAEGEIGRVSVGGAGAVPKARHGGGLGPTACEPSYFDAFNGSGGPKRRGLPNVNAPVNGRLRQSWVKAGSRDLFIEIIFDGSRSRLPALRAW